MKLHISHDNAHNPSSARSKQQEIEV